MLSEVGEWGASYTEEPLFPGPQVRVELEKLR